MACSRIRMMSLSIAILLVAVTSPSAVHRFVSGTGDDARDGSTEALAFRNLSKAAGVVNPGDTVWMLTGTYAAFTITRSGTAQAWIVWKKKPGATPELKNAGWNAIDIRASYQVVDGLTVTGNNDAVTLAAAEADYANASPNGFYNGNGISMDGRNVTAKYHHLTVRNCIIRKCCGGGLSAIDADHVTFEDNQVYENAWYARYGCSGISLLVSRNVDQDTGYHMIIQRNRVWNNRGLVKWKQIDDYSDGNGIIIDSDKNNGFTGRTLVCNNVSFNNGGSGIHAYKSAHVDIINNTTYLNGQVVNYANCFANSSTDVRILNNIIYAAPGKPANVNSRDTNVTYDYNIHYGGLAPVVNGAHDLVIDPGLVNASIDPSVADFRLKPSSPALNAGMNFPLVSTDILGVSRPQGSGNDIGAYEYVTTTRILSRADRLPGERPRLVAPRGLSAMPTRGRGGASMNARLLDARGRCIEGLSEGRGQGLYVNVASQ